MSVFVSGRTTYDLPLTGGAVADPGRLTLSQLFNASVLNGGGEISFDNSDFVANASAGFFDWQLNFDVHSGDQIQITSSLQAESDAGGAGLNLGLTSKTFAFDAMNTSLLRTISVPTAYTITSDSGELIAHDGAFAYRATIGSVPVPVPEPQSWLLITAGLAAITARRRRFAAGR